MSKPGSTKPEDLDPEQELADLDSLYSPAYLRDCADSNARAERLEELKRRIAHDSYHVDPDRIADELLSRGELD